VIFVWALAQFDQPNELSGQLGPLYPHLPYRLPDLYVLLTLKIHALCSFDRKDLSQHPKISFIYRHHPHLRIGAVELVIVLNALLVGGLTSDIGLWCGELLLRWLIWKLPSTSSNHFEVPTGLNCILLCLASTSEWVTNHKLDSISILTYFIFLVKSTTNANDILREYASPAVFDYLVDVIWSMSCAGGEWVEWGERTAVELPRWRLLGARAW